MKKTVKKISLILLLFVSCILAFSVCLRSSVQAASKIQLNKTNASIAKNATLQLKVTGTKKAVKWSSNRKSVATVSQKGKVTAKSVGKATITAKVGAKKITCKITVTQYPNYKKLILGTWSGPVDGDYVVWKFKSNGTFVFTYYPDADPDKGISTKGKYIISGNKLYLSTDEVYTIKLLDKNQTLVLKNPGWTYWLYSYHV